MNIDERLLLLIERQTQPSRRFKELEELTKISANRWQSVWHRRQRPMPDMLEIAAQIWPVHAFWLITGVTDVEHGHVAPKDVVPVIEPMERSTASTKDYFALQIGYKKNQDDNTFWQSEKYLSYDIGIKIFHYNFASSGNRSYSPAMENLREMRTRRLAELQAVSAMVERELTLDGVKQMERIKDKLDQIEATFIREKAK